jgi:Zn-dependent protease with chaperone function
MANYLKTTLLLASLTGLILFSTHPPNEERIKRLRNMQIY